MRNDPRSHNYSRALWAAMNRLFRPLAKKPRPKGSGRVGRWFSFRINGEEAREFALTRSQARAQLKARLKVERLPAGASVLEAKHPAGCRSQTG